MNFQMAADLASANIATHHHGRRRRGRKIDLVDRTAQASPRTLIVEKVVGAARNEAPRSPS